MQIWPTVSAKNAARGAETGIKREEFCVVSELEPLCRDEHSEPVQNITLLLVRATIAVYNGTKKAALIKGLLLEGHEILEKLSSQHSRLQPSTIPVSTGEIASSSDLPELTVILLTLHRVDTITIWL